MSTHSTPPAEDLSALAWVNDELRRSLEAANKALRRYLRDAAAAAGSDVDDVDPAVLRSARVQLHQGAGALELIGMPQVARVLHAGEAVVRRFIAKPKLVDEAAVETVERLNFAVLDYVQRLLAGKTLSPLALYPQYAAAQALAGADRVHPADLWTQEIQWHALPADASARALPIDDSARETMESLVLPLMRQADPGLQHAMSDLCAGLGETTEGDMATLWRLAAAVYEAQSAGLLATDLHSKRLASRLLAQLRHAVRGEDGASTRLAQDLLFFCARARAPGTARQAPRLAAVHAVWTPDPAAAIDYETARLGLHDPGQIALARRRVGAAKDVWSALAGNEMHRLGGLQEAFALLGESLEGMFPGGASLAHALKTATGKVAASQAAPEPALAMEVATSLLYVDAVLEEGELDQPGLAERVQRMALRVKQVGVSGEGEALEPWMEELYRRTSDRQTMGSVVQELRATLSEAEKQIDQYFRDPRKRELLIPVPGQLASMRGVLTVLGMDQASQAVMHMRLVVDELTQTEADPEQVRKAGTFDRLADNLGALSFLIDMISVQPQLAKRLFRYDPETGALSAVMGQSERPSLFGAFDAEPRIETAAAGGDGSVPVAASPAPPAVPTPTTGLEDDAEMREIFLEEAQEVLADARGSLGELAVRLDDLNAMTAVRRAFHTLKGSSRMVGLTAFGDAAWSCEQLYNARLAVQGGINADVVGFSGEALDYLASWVDTIAAGRGDEGHEAIVVARAADSLRLHEQRLPVAAGADAATPTSLVERVPDLPSATDLELPAMTPAAGPEPVAEPESLAEPERVAEPWPDAMPDVVEVSELPALDAELPEIRELPAVAEAAKLPVAETAAGDELVFELDLGGFDEEAPTLQEAGRTDSSSALTEPMALEELPSLDLPADESLGFDLDLGGDEAAPDETLLPVAETSPMTLEDEALLPVPDTGAGPIEAGQADADSDAALPELHGLEALDEAFDPSQFDAVEPFAPAAEAAAPEQALDLPLAQDPAMEAVEAEDGPDTLASPLTDTQPARLADAPDTAAGGLDVGAAGGAQAGRDEVIIGAESATEDDGFRVVGPLRIAIPLFNIFLSEADEQSRRLGIELAEWALEQDQPVAESAIALAHSLAGNSGTVGFVDLSVLARALEHALMRSQAVGCGSPGEAELFVDAADEIRRLLHQFAAGFLQAVDPRLMQRLSDHERMLVAIPRQEAPDSQVGALDPIVVVPPALADMPSPASRLDLDDDLDAVDAIDPDLFPIFDEEADELMPQLRARLAEWHRHPSQPGAPAACLRTLHTFKGGARLAGAMRVGEMAHRLETAIEALSSRGEVTVDDVDQLMLRADTMATALDRLRHPQSAEAAAAEPAPPPAIMVTPEPEPEPAEADLPAPAFEAEAAPASEPVVDRQDCAAEPEPETAGMPAPPDAEPRVAGKLPAIDWSRFAAAPELALAEPQAAEARGSAAQGAMVRVRAPLLDRLVNEAGEVSITRARIEGDVRLMQGSLNDLTENLERLRRQLRDLELQAESQITSRIEAAKAAAESFDPLEMDRFTRFQELTRMMAESVNDVATVQRGIQRSLQSTEDELAAQARLTRDLQDDLLRTRMVEFESLVDRLYRVVRQASKDSGKTVRLDIAGGSIEVDRGVLDRMIGPFEHLLRNAVAHGIETPERRRAAGKEASGSITITVTHERNEVGVEFADDGAGLDLARIRALAIERGLLTAEDRPTDSELMNLIFEAGFSTAETVSALAGRGVGMDVVRAEVNAMGGRIEVHSTPGRGAKMKLVLPLTTAVTQVVMLRFGDQRIAVPSTLVELVRRTTADEVRHGYSAGSITHADGAVPFFWLGALLQHDAPPIGNTRSQVVVIVRSASQRVALHVDEVLGNQEVVVKNLGPQLSRLPGIAGITLLPSGAAALIYNPVALASIYGLEARHRSAAPLRVPSLTDAPAANAGETPSVALAPLVLVVDDSLTVRRVTQRLLVREGYRVTLAKDGLEAIEKLAAERPAVLLTDIEMPRMDGFDLVRNVRADERLAELPVIMITSRIAPKHREHAAELGVDHYLGKPYSEEELLGHVARYTRTTVPA